MCFFRRNFARNQKPKIWYIRVPQQCPRKNELIENLGANRSKALKNPPKTARLLSFVQQKNQWMEPKSSQRRNLRKVCLIWKPITEKNDSQWHNYRWRSQNNSNFVFVAKTHRKLSDHKQKLVGDRLSCLQSASTEFTKSIKRVKKILGVYQLSFKIRCCGGVSDKNTL